VLNAPLAGVAPGQACVFYEGARVLGGGWITRKASSAPLRGTEPTRIPAV
jgi:tRNA-specific 2-thiouridylase